MQYLVSFMPVTLIYYFFFFLSISVLAHLGTDPVLPSLQWASISTAYSQEDQSPLNSTQVCKPEADSFERYAMYMYIDHM